MNKINTPHPQVLDQSQGIAINKMLKYMPQTNKQMWKVSVLFRKPPEIRSARECVVHAHRLSTNSAASTDHTQHLHHTVVTVPMSYSDIICTCMLLVYK